MTTPRRALFCLLVAPAAFLPAQSNCTLLVNLIGTISSIAHVNGNAFATLRLPDDPLFLGDIHLQWGGSRSVPTRSAWCSPVVASRGAAAGNT